MEVFLFFDLNFLNIFFTFSKIDYYIRIVKEIEEMEKLILIPGLGYMIITEELITELKK